MNTEYFRPLAVAFTKLADLENNNMWLSEFIFSETLLAKNSKIEYVKEFF